MIMYARLCMPFASLLVLTACIYIPTPEHGLVTGRAMIREDVIQQLKLGVGKLTREDVLLKFGDPNRRMNDDEIFCYGWERRQAWVLMPYDYGEVGKVHWLCMQFDSKTKLVRIAHIEPILWGNATKEKDAILDEWKQANPQAGVDVHK